MYTYRLFLYFDAFVAVMELPIGVGCFIAISQNLDETLVRYLYRIHCLVGYLLTCCNYIVVILLFEN